MNVLTEIEHHGIIPVIAIDSADNAEPLADALLEGGLPLIEITFRTDAALEVIARIIDLRPEIQVGAGTVLNTRQLDAANQAGARFALAPGFDVTVLEYAKKHDIRFIPGAMTPSELQGCIQFGVRTMKFFPAGVAGGPFAHLGVGFIPTGGVNPNNLCQWLSLNTVTAVGGTWLATRDDIANGKWHDITTKVRQALAIVAEAKEKTYDNI